MWSGDHWLGHLTRSTPSALSLLAGIAFSLIVETTQLAISVLLGFTYKIADIDDLILNSAGVVVGYAGFLLLRTAFDEDLTTEGAIDITAPS